MADYLSRNPNSVDISAEQKINQQIKLIITNKMSTIFDYITSYIVKDYNSTLNYVLEFTTKYLNIKEVQNETKKRTT